MASVSRKSGFWRTDQHGAEKSSVRPTEGRLITTPRRCSYEKGIGARRLCTVTSIRGGSCATGAARHSADLMLATPMHGRSSFGSIGGVAREGVPLVVIQRQLGHAGHWPSAASTWKGLTTAR